MQWTRRRSSSCVQIERFPFFFQSKDCVQIPMWKEYPAANKVMNRFADNLLKFLDNCIIHFCAPETAYEIIIIELWKQTEKNALIWWRWFSVNERQSSFVVYVNAYVSICRNQCRYQIGFPHSMDQQNHRSPPVWVHRLQSLRQYCCQYHPFFFCNTRW